MEGTYTYLLCWVLRGFSGDTRDPVWSSWTLLHGTSLLNKQDKSVRFRGAQVPADPGDVFHLQPTQGTCSTYGTGTVSSSAQRRVKSRPHVGCAVAIRGLGQLSVRGFSDKAWLPGFGARRLTPSFLRHLLLSHTNSRMSQAGTLFISKPFSACGFGAKCGNLRESAPPQSSAHPCRPLADLPPQLLEGEEGGWGSGTRCRRNSWEFGKCR